MKTEKYLSLILFVFLSLMMLSCVTSPENTNIRPLLLKNKPLVETYQDPSASFEDYNTFSVIPFSLISGNTDVNEILEKQLLFFLRNAIENKGYKYVEIDESPDFLITIHAKSEYSESYIPPSSITLPQYVPGQLSTTYGSNSGSFNYNSFGSLSTYGYGHYSGTSTSTTYTPGYFTSETITRPGYNVGYHYPSVGISVYNSKTFQRIWHGIGAGTSDNHDVRISGQLVTGNILASFPKAKHPFQYKDLNIGALGTICAVITIDGNNYTPTIVSFSQNSPAKKAGLRLYDIITSIDGTSVVNKTVFDIFELSTGSPGSKANIQVFRNGNIYNFEVDRIQITELIN